MTIATLWFLSALCLHCAWQVIKSSTKDLWALPIFKRETSKNETCKEDLVPTPSGRMHLGQRFLKAYGFGPVFVSKWHFYSSARRSDIGGLRISTHPSSLMIYSGWDQLGTKVRITKRTESPYKKLFRFEAEISYP